VRRYDALNSSMQYTSNLPTRAHAPLHTRCFSPIVLQENGWGQPTQHRPHAVTGQCLQGRKLTADLAESFSTYNGYINSASKTLMANVKAGKTFPDAAPRDDQAHSLIKVPVVVARYFGTIHTSAAPAT
jgi:hypothetical protein